MVGYLISGGLSKRQVNAHSRWERISHVFGVEDLRECPLNQVVVDKIDLSQRKKGQVPSAFQQVQNINLFKRHWTYTADILVRGQVLYIQKQLNMIFESQGIIVLLTLPILYLLITRWWLALVYWMTCSMNFVRDEFYFNYTVYVCTLTNTLWCYFLSSNLYLMQELTDSK